MTHPRARRRSGHSPNPSHTPAATVGPPQEHRTEKRKIRETHRRAQKQTKRRHTINNPHASTHHSKGDAFSPTPRTRDSQIKTRTRARTKNVLDDADPRDGNATYATMDPPGANVGAVRLVRRAVRGEGDLQDMARMDEAVAEPARARNGDTPGRRAVMTPVFQARAERLQNMLAAARIAPRPVQDAFAPPASPGQETNNNNNNNNALVPSSSAMMLPAYPTTPQRGTNSAMAIMQQQQMQQWGAIAQGLNNFAARQDEALRRQADLQQAILDGQEQQRADARQANAAILAALQGLAAVSAPSAPASSTASGFTPSSSANSLPDVTPTARRTTVASVRGHARRGSLNTPTRVRWARNVNPRGQETHNEEGEGEQE
ncbi:hypothetical protein L249_5390, partial [Ophiocordyceps polyrhachis-furcata BCC 54312]